MIKPTEAELSSQALEAAPPTFSLVCGNSRCKSSLEQPSEGSVTALVSLEPGVRAGTEIPLRAGKAKGQEKRRALGVSWEVSLLLGQ